MTYRSQPWRHRSLQAGCRRAAAPVWLAHGAATSLESYAFPIDTSMLVGFVVAAVLALAMAGSVYLPMINHGHYFVRLFVWHSGRWGFWAYRGSGTRDSEFGHNIRHDDHDDL